GMDAAGKLARPDVVAQTKRALENVRAVLAAAGCGMRDVIRLQTFLTGPEYIEGFMQARREVFPVYYPDGAYPPNTLLVISRLVRPELLVEIEAMAVRPSRAGVAPKRAAKSRARTARATRKRR
ncbi:MAG: RidA family protein, partial [Candidatus Rokubacteria bacterium]|nr:RidA family protein [Candidatus Rokubacteria bacterium]